MRTTCVVFAAVLACLPVAARPPDSADVDYATYLQSPVKGYAFLAAAAATESTRATRARSTSDMRCAASRHDL